MKNRIFSSVVAGLIPFGMVGTNLARDSHKRDSPPPFQIFEVYAFTET
jgi:hypothetical protein